MDMNEVKQVLRSFAVGNNSVELRTRALDLLLEWDDNDARVVDGGNIGAINIPGYIVRGIDTLLEKNVQLYSGEMVSRKIEAIKFLREWYKTAHPECVPMGLKEGKDIIDKW